MVAQQVVNSPLEALVIGVLLAVIGLGMIMLNRPFGRLLHDVYGDRLTRASGAGPTSTGRYSYLIATGCGFIAAAVGFIVYGLVQ